MQAEHLNQLYRYIPIWQRKEDHACLYRVIEIIGVGFVVQSCDFFHRDSDAKHFSQLDQQFVELLMDTPPEKRMPPQISIQQAVAEFEQQFQAGA